MCNTMEHYKPIHPLPDEIKSMQRDETVCQFCGVSYLIHNEIKALEIKLAKAEEELVHLRGLESREIKLIESLRALEQTEEVLSIQLRERDSLISMLQTNLYKTEASLSKVKEELDSKTQELAESCDSMAKINVDNVQLRQAVGKLLSYLKNHKENLNAVRREFSTCQKDTLTAMQTVEDTVENSLQNLVKEKLQQDDHIKNLNKSVSSKQQMIERISTQLDIAQQDLTAQNNISKQLSEALAARNKAMDHNTELKNNIRDMESTSRQLIDESESLKKALQKKSHEFDSLKQQLVMCQSQHETRLGSLSAELNMTRVEMERLKDKYDSAVREEEINKQKQIEQSRIANLSKEESSGLKSRLERALADLDAYKNEREQMISAHHNRIDELRESFKRKMLEADKWPEKLEAAVQQERNEYQSELSALEKGLKENFAMEMDIEKQKHEKLIEKISSEYKSEVNKLKGQLKTQISNQTEMDSLKQQLKTSKAEAQGTEARLRSEVESLKNIIANLESRLGKLDTVDHELITKLKSSLSEKEGLLEKSTDRIRVQDEELKQLNQQLHLLQDTVSRECEERQELITALSEAKEQLLLLKKPSGGYSARNPSPKQLKSISSISDDGASILTDHLSSRSEQIKLYRGATQNSFRSQSDSSSVKSNAESHSSVKNIDFKTENLKSKPLQALKTMDDVQKKRLAAILSRDKT